jgi:tetratricopeptide (TPR) repeat protein
MDLCHATEHSQRAHPHYGSECSPSRLRWRWAAFLPAGLIVVAGLAVYANSFQGPFIFDDFATIVDNPTIRHLWPLGPVLTPPAEGGTVTSRPLFNLSLAINYRLGGFNVWGYHATNLAIHLINGLLLLGILWRTFHLPALQARFGEAACGLSLAIALLWTVHPLQTESVTYINQRAESLAGLFYLLTVYSVIRGSRSSRAVWWHTLAVGACWIGVAVKEPVVTAPLVVLLYDHTFLKESFRKILRRRWGLYLGLFASWGILIYLQARTGLPVLKEQLGSLGFLAYVRSEPGVILYYLRLSLWPHPLCFNYDWPVADTLAAILPGVLVIGGLGVATVWGLAKRRTWALLGAWFFLILAPTSSLMPLPHLAFEHRMYLSLAAVLTGVVVGVYVGVQFLMGRKSIGGRTRLLVGTALLTLAAVLLGFLTIKRNDAYQTPSSIWEDTLSKVPDNPTAHTALGAALVNAGRLTEAAEHYHLALRRNPNDTAVLTNLGFVLASLGRPSEAIEYYQRAIGKQPDHWLAHNNFAAALAALGRVPEAIEHYEEAIRLNPGYVKAHDSLGNALANAGRLAEAVEHYDHALRITPDNAPLHNSLADTLMALDRLSEAIQHYEQASKLDPNSGEIHNNLAVALLKSGRLNEAIDQFQLAVRLNSQLVDARYNLAKALVRAGRFHEAVEQGREAIRQVPNQARIYRFLAWLIATHEPDKVLDPAEAVKLAEQACALTARHDAVCLDTLAAAYASAGRFSEAESTAKEAWQLAQAMGQVSLAEEIHIRLQLYRDRKPYREPLGASRFGTSSSVDRSDGGAVACQDRGVGSRERWAQNQGRSTGK